MQNLPNDIYFMKQAIDQAQLAAEAGEIPVGAVITDGKRIIARAHNQCETLNDVTAHAEMLALTAAASVLGAKYLATCSLYVTTEPCPMCAGALYWSQIGKFVFGCSDEKRGYRNFSPTLVHKRTQVVSGIMAEECGKLMTDFFEGLRRRG